jgi:hypothetical protein
MSKFVMSHAKSYKASQVGNLRAHEEREFEHNVNVFPELTPENRSHSYAEFPELNQRMIDAKIAAGVRPSNVKFRRDANVMFSNVVALSREHIEIIKAEYPDTWKDQIMACARTFSESLKSKHGFEPMSISLHLDEGYFHEGEFVPNVHMHINFFNFDFERLVQPQRTMKRHHFSELQDLAGAAFAPLGFERGHRDVLGGRKHLEKREHVRRELDTYKEEIKEKKVNALDREKQDFQSKRELMRAQAALEIEELASEKQRIIENLEFRIGRGQQMLRSVNQTRDRVKSEVADLEKNALSIKQARNPREMILERQNAELKERVQKYEKNYGILEENEHLESFNSNDALAPNSGIK